ncbi:ribosome-binding factor A, partial [bacterium]|nr:ribosome-binding factor A [bacterium]
MEQRARQIAEVIQHELNNFFVREVEFPKDSLATLIKVDVTPDLKHAILYVSIL